MFFPLLGSFKICEVMSSDSVRVGIKCMYNCTKIVPLHNDHGYVSLCRFSPESYLWKYVVCCLFLDGLISDTSLVAAPVKGKALAVLNLEATDMIISHRLHQVLSVTLYIV